MNSFNNELVSIITPVYNGEKWIGDCIKSVQAQTYDNWEMIIVNDNSSDNTIKEVESYLNDKRIKLFTNEKNMHVAYSRNVAINNAKGRYIAFLDSDDMWYPNKLERQLAFMKENHYHFTFTGYEMFKDSGELITKIQVPSVIDYTGYLKNTIIGCLTVIVDRKDIPEFKSEIGKLEDVKTWMYLLKNHFNAYGLNENLAKYRVSSNSASGNKIKNAQLYFDCLRKSQKLSLIKSLYYECWYMLNAIKKRLMK